MNEKKLNHSSVVQKQEILVESRAHTNRINKEILKASKSKNLNLLLKLYREEAELYTHEKFKTYLECYKKVLEVSPFYFARSFYDYDSFVPTITPYSLWHAAQNLRERGLEAEAKEFEDNYRLISSQNITVWEQNPKTFYQLFLLDGCRSPTYIFEEPMILAKKGCPEDGLRLAKLICDTLSKYAQKAIIDQHLATFFHLIKSMFRKFDRPDIAYECLKVMEEEANTPLPWLAILYLELGLKKDAKKIIENHLRLAGEDETGTYNHSWYERICCTLDSVTRDIFYYFPNGDISELCFTGLELSYLKEQLAEQSLKNSIKYLKFPGNYYKLVGQTFEWAKNVLGDNPAYHGLLEEYWTEFLENGAYEILQTEIESGVEFLLKIGNVEKAKELIPYLHVEEESDFLDLQY